MSDRLSYDDVHRLVVKMREGSTEARRELIEAHVALAFKASRDFDDDESLSDALCTLVEEVDTFRVSGRHPAALPAFLKVAVTKAAHRHCRNDAEARRKSGRTGGNYRHCSFNDALKFMDSGRSILEYHGHSIIDLMDQVLAACEDEQEREMIYWRTLSMSYAEVALQIGSNFAHVQRSLEQLKLRFAVQERFNA